MKKIVFVLLLAGANLFAQDEIPSKSSEDPLAGLKFRKLLICFNQVDVIISFKGTGDVATDCCIKR